MRLFVLSTETMTDNVPPAADEQAVQEWATAHKISPDWLKALFKDGFTSLESIHLLEKEDLSHKIPRGHGSNVSSCMLWESSGNQWHCQGKATTRTLRGLWIRNLRRNHRTRTSGRFCRHTRPRRDSLSGRRHSQRVPYQSPRPSVR